jgi:DNA-binding winged helix-turn-helix (wHTH) protein
MNNINDNSGRQYIFGDFILEPKEERLSRISLERVELTGKPFEVLVLLVENQGHLTTRDNLMAKVWPETYRTADQSLTEAVSRIRKALDPTWPEKYIQTVQGKGYRFAWPVSVVVQPAGGATDTSRAAGSTGLKLFVAGLLFAVIATGIGFGILRHRHLLSRHRPTLYETAIGLEAEGKDESAIDALNEVQNSDPKYVDARIEAAWIQYQSDDDDDARKSLGPLADPNAISSLEQRDRAVGLKLRGMDQLLDGKTDKALHNFQLAAETSPADVRTLIYVADIAISESDLKDADDALAKCRTIDGQNPFCEFEHLYLLAYKGQYVDAVNEYNVVGKSLNYPWLEEPVGYAELAMEKLPEARGHFNSLVGHARGGNWVHFRAAQDGFASAYLLRGKLSSAVGELAAAEDQTPSKFEKADYLIEMASIEALIGDNGQTRQNLVQAANLSDSPELAPQIARIFAMIGDGAFAERFLQKTQAGSDLGQGSTKPFISGIEALGKKDFERATNQLSISFNMDPSPETSYFLAQAEMGNRDWGAAIDSLNSVLANRVRTFTDGAAYLVPLAEYDLSICYRGEGKKPEARQHLETAQTMWKDADPTLKALLDGRQ